MFFWFLLVGVAGQSCGEDYGCQEDHPPTVALLQNEHKILPSIFASTPLEGLTDVSSQDVVPDMDRQSIEFLYNPTRCAAPNANGHLHLSHKHMSKCGGTTLLHVLPQMARGFDYCEIAEQTPIAEQVSNNSFVIAGVRNPCDYYVSLWAYQHGKPWATQQDEVCDCFDLHEDSGHTDVEQFGKWLKWVQGGGHGPMTYRFWETLVAKRSGLTCWADTIPSCASSFNDTEIESSFAVEAFPPSAVDCWVRTENFGDDLEKCLLEYERTTGVALNWEPFHQAVAEGHNTSPHKTCSEYYTPELAALVMENDKHIFDGFGYSTCCGPADN